METKLHGLFLRTLIFLKVIESVPKVLLAINWNKLLVCTYTNGRLKYGSILLSADGQILQFNSVAFK